MSSFHDNYPDLPLTIDIGGDRYYLGSDKPVELAYKSRKEFVEAFPSKKGKTVPAFPAEYLLRKHMVVTGNPMKTFNFTHPGEREALISVLEGRANRIKQSMEFTSSILKHTALQRSYLQIQEILQELRGTKDVGAENSAAATSATSDVEANPLPPIPEEKLLQIILELTWYLLHPGQMSPKLQAEWKEMVQELDTLRLGDIMAKIRTLQEEKGKNNSAVRPLNYFKKMNIGEIAKQPTITNALEEAVKMATKVDDTVSKEDMEERLKALLHVLQTKKYLNNSYQFDESRLDTIETEVIPSIERTMIQNPVQDKAMNHSLAVAMAPISDHFREMFDPIYGFVESSVLSYLRKNGGAKGEHLLPQLLILLHVSEFIEESDGIYELINVHPDLLDFMRHLLRDTQAKMASLSANEKAKSTFVTQLTSLPHVRLSDTVPQSIFRSSTEVPLAHVQYFMAGINMIVPSVENYVSKRRLTEDIHKGITEFIKPDHLYVTCTDTDTEPIPINLYRIDMSKVTVDSDHIPVKPVKFKSMEELFKNKELEDVVNIDPAVRCTFTEITLCLLIAFQDLMPK